MANENKLTTLGQMQDFAQRQDARDDEQDELLQNHTHKTITEEEIDEILEDEIVETGPDGETYIPMADLVTGETYKIYVSDGKLTLESPAGKIVASIPEYIPVTQSEYNALVRSGNVVQGTKYMIVGDNT